MIRGRRKKVVFAAGAGVLIAVASLAVVPLAASASGATSSTSLTAAPPSATTGEAVSITAAVTGNVGVPTGTVTFTITGSDASTLNCATSDVRTLSGGSAVCHIKAEQLVAAASPYTIGGAYSGDGNYAGSSGGTSLTVTQATTKTKIKVKPKVKDGSGNTFTATVSSTGQAGSLLAGTVTFAVSDAPPTSNAKRKCAGGDTQPIVVKGKVATATCVLAAGWIVVPAPTKTDKHPFATWNVTGSYNGNVNFLGSTGTKSGKHVR